MKRHRVNWHEAAVCAMQIELQDYSHLLSFYPEYVLGQNSYRIDLLIIQKLLDVPIPKNIAKIFKTYNIFEIKGVGSSVTTDAYYKTNGYAGLLIDSRGKRNQYTRQNISLSFLSTNYPRKLFHHLTKDCKLMVEKFSSGIYYISNEMYQTQVLVTGELSPEDNLYLRCLSNKLNNDPITKKLADDLIRNQNKEIYANYLNQLAFANTPKKGESDMVCEGLLYMFGTSSEEIEDKATKAAQDIYIPQINELTEQNEYLKSLLSANGIDY